ncbi:hypothetical protein GY45DRAFT_1375849 [Cubamyces sp. BRFM 1775]|nr:hypothetical protein GY45DRAFT_1375849 [Cubamyces sp. BRFM 1775]
MFSLPENEHDLYRRAAMLEQQWKIGRTYDGKGGQYKPTYKPQKNHHEKDPDAMDINKMQPEECEKHYREGPCFNCHQVGHLARQCPLKKGKGGDRKGKAKTRIMEVAKESDNDNDAKSTSTKVSSSSKKLIAARICLTLKDLDDKQDRKDVVSDLLDKGF